MTDATSDRFSREVLGPIVAEFCYRLWLLQQSVPHPDDTVLLFCARGGLRMEAAYQAFLASTGLPQSAPSRSLMVSRVAALRSSLAATLGRGEPAGPAARAAMYYEFSSLTLRQAMLAVAGIDPGVDGLDEPFSSDGFDRAIASGEFEPSRTAVIEQGELFSRHLSEVLAGRSTALLVDTGLYGTTGQLVAEAHPELTVSTALIARTFRPLRGARDTPAIGLLVTARRYTPLHARTAVLRYWHLVEWLFEPELPSVTSFTLDDGAAVRSNTEIAGWRSRIPAPPDHPFAGVLEHLGALAPSPALHVPRDAQRAWRRFRRAVVWPDWRDARTLAVGARSHDFGRSDTWDRRQWRGPVAALRGSATWREGEIASSRSPLRVPLLAGIEGAYTVRALWRAGR